MMTQKSAKEEMCDLVKVVNQFCLSVCLAAAFTEADICN